jgi:hypothetical protein
MRTIATRLALALGLVAGAAGQAGAGLMTFAASGTFAEGGALGGTVTIDTTTGALTAVDLMATVTHTFRFTTNIGGVPDYAGSGLFVIVADDPSGGYPIGLFGLPVSSLVGYAGGPISGASTIFFPDGSTVGLTNGNLAPVPEPSGIVLAGLGIVGLVIGHARRRRRA